jgi:hypothetical protein
MTYNVTFIFPDSSGRNHQVTRAVFDKGVWDSLRANQEVKVYYLASDPEQAAIQGTEGLAVPHGAALRFVGWTLILAAAGCGVAAFRRANNTADPNSGTGQPKRKVVHAGKR